MSELPTPALWRKDFYLTALIIIFNLMQLWAFMVVLLAFHPTGTTLLALGLILTGSVIGTIAGWRYIARQNRYRISAPPRRPYGITPVDDLLPTETTRTDWTTASSAGRSTRVSRRF